MAVPMLCLAVTLFAVVMLRTQRDAVVGLIAYLAVLYLIPARMVLPGAGAVGTPAVVVGIALFGWWLMSRMLPGVDMPDGPQPIRLAIALYFGWLLLTYAFVIRRPLSVIEANGSQRAVITAFALFGVAAVAADGIADRARLERLIAALVFLASGMAVFGLFQFFTPIDPVSYIRIPGLELTREISVTTGRGVLNRPFSTALHPIEFGVVMALVFPLAMYRLSRADTDGATRAARWVPVILIGAAVPLTVSRSAILAFVVAVGYYAVSLPGRSRLNLAGAVALSVAAARAVVPGLVGTFGNLFFGAGSDPSVQTRLSDVSVVLRMVSTYPMMGWGPGIMNVDEYTLLDNQFYVTTIEMGVIGLVLLFGLIATGVIVGRRVAKLASDDETRRLAYALTGAVLAAGVSMATFDGFAFRIFSGMLFVLLGMVGALWRIQGAAVEDGRKGIDGAAGSLSMKRTESSWT